MIGAAAKIRRVTLRIPIRMALAEIAHAIRHGRANPSFQPGRLDLIFKEPAQAGYGDKWPSQ
jgi:hypothetical protein